MHQIYFHVKHEEVTALSNGQGLTWETRAVMKRNANTLTVSKQAQRHLQNPHCTHAYKPCALTPLIHTTHSLAHEALATWYLNLPPGREWKMCHRCYLLHSHEQRWLTAGWIAPLCSMMQCNVVGGWGGRGACGHLFTVVCIGGSGVGARWNHSAR